MGDPATSEVALGPVIDAAQHDGMHRLVTESVTAGARLAGGPVTAPAFAEEVFGPVAPVVAYEGFDQALALATATPYGLELGSNREFMSFSSAPWSR
ncbi:aldehyde dehydrogenase family protein [Streptomyces sp. NPDC051572]|uniref:aldehyde dehydrogenase family protein n=1 Tax=unclassified Streptomyces TaxID=2593676 RepID=UPI00344C73E7